MESKWKILRDRSQGSSHRHSGVPCQDHEISGLVKCANEDILFLCCSDGAGSAKYSEIGSQLVCMEMWRSVERSLQNNPVSRVSDELVPHWITEVRTALVSEALQRNIPLREMACTVVGAVVALDSSIFFQIGDGGIVFRDGSDFQIPFWPQSGEYINETNFITSEGYLNDLRCKRYEQRISEISLFTDGLQSLILNFTTKSPHAPFFETMFDTLAKQEVPELTVPFKGFLESQRVNDCTDDDKTLILALRTYSNADIL